MPKRKRDEASNGQPESTEKAPSSSRTSNRRKKLCIQRIAAAQKPLVSALRLAAGFERQKFSRRKKGAKSTNNDKASQRLETEYAKLKQLDLNKVAEQHLRRTIGKVKSLRESADIPEHEKVVEKGEQDVALLNVQARLFKVDAVRKAVDEAIDDLKEIIGAGAGAGGAKGQIEADGAKKKKKQKSESNEEEEPQVDIEAFDSDVLAAFDARIAAPSSVEGDSEDSLSDGHRPPSIGDSESADDDELDLDEEMESDEDTVHVSANGPNIAKGSSDSGALHDLDIGSESGSDSETDEISAPQPKSKRKAVLLEKPSASTFLPSLSHAAYFSGSESEASDLDADLAPRKNRRGQKARQRIWEQKYGDKAKHKEKEDRAQGWDAKRGAVGDRNGGRGRNGPPRGYGPEKSGENAIPLGQKKITKRDDVGNLHPSWLAAKAAKEKKSGLKIDLGAKSSKKVVFD